MKKLQFNKILVISRGRWGVRLLETLYAMGYRPENLYVLRDNEEVDEPSELEDFVRRFNIKSIDYSEFYDSAMKIDLVISFDNDRIMSREFIEKSTIIINFHPGLLPEYRGSNCSVHAWVNGERYVGGTWHYLIEKVDGGNMILREKVEISEVDTAFSLHYRIYKNAMVSLQEVFDLVSRGYKGIELGELGTFYRRKDFPKKPESMSADEYKRLTYFPPKFI